MTIELITFLRLKKKAVNYDIIELITFLRVETKELNYD